MKKRRIGSSSIYCVNVRKPTSNRTRAPAIVAAVVEPVISHTVRYEKGTKNEPRAVQHCKYSHNSSNLLNPQISEDPSPT